jgi:hypothetical protein
MNVTTLKFLMIPLLIFGALFGVRNFTGEVATLYTSDGMGERLSSRVWVVDHGHELWIRSLDPMSGWLDHIINHPDVQLERAGAIANFRATPHTGRKTRVNALMAERYGWAEWVLAKIEDRDDAVPVYLDPVH